MLTMSWILSQYYRRKDGVLALTLNGIKWKQSRYDIKNKSTLLTNDHSYNLNIDAKHPRRKNGQCFVIVSKIK